MEWLETKYYPVDQEGKLIRVAHAITFAMNNIVCIRETDNDVDVGRTECHILTSSGVDYTIAEPYTEVLKKL